MSADAGAAVAEAVTAAPPTPVAQADVIPTPYMSKGNLVIMGTNLNDSVTVTDYVDSRGATLHEVRHRVYVAGSGYQTKYTHIQRSQVTSGQVIFHGLDGNDTFLYRSASAHPLDVIAYGGAGRDSLTGSSGDDRLFGQAGQDYLTGGAGIDILRGGADSDTLHGGDHDDALFGEGGQDSLFGEKGNDFLDGGSDNCRDIVTGGDGADKYKAEWYWSGGWWFNNEQFMGFDDWSQGDSIINPVSGPSSLQQKVRR